MLMPSNKIAISAKGLSKLFRKQKQRTFKEMVPALLGRGKKGVVDSFWALRDVNFEIIAGDQQPRLLNHIAVAVVHTGVGVLWRQAGDDVGQF